MLGKCALVTVLLVVSMVTAGCTSQIPVATNYPYTEQQKMQAASHWRVLAAEVVGELQRREAPSKITPLAVYPSFVHEGEDRALWTTTKPLGAVNEGDPSVVIPFKRAYRNFLIAELVNAGYRVVDDGAQAKALITFDIQLVRQADRPSRLPHLLSLLRRLIGGGLDGAYAGVKPGNHELVVTTSVKSGDAYVMSHTGSYYVNSPWHDTNYSQAGKIMELVER
jgi:hypothetical protein